MNLSAVGFSFITLVSCFLSLSVLLQFNGLFSPSTRHMRSDSVFIEAASCLFQAQVLFIFFVFHPHIESCSYAIKTNTNSLCVWSKVSGDSVHMHRHDTIQDTSFIINKATNAVSYRINRQRVYQQTSPFFIKLSIISNNAQCVENQSSWLIIRLEWGYLTAGSII